MNWVRFLRPDIELDPAPGVLLVRLESVVGLEGGPDQQLTYVLLRGGFTRMVAGSLDSVQAQLDAAHRRSGGGA